LPEAQSSSRYILLRSVSKAHARKRETPGRLCPHLKACRAIRFAVDAASLYELVRSRRRQRVLGDVSLPAPAMMMQLLDVIELRIAARNGQRRARMRICSLPQGDVGQSDRDSSIQTTAVCRALRSRPRAHFPGHLRPTRHLSSAGLAGFSTLVMHLIVDSENARQTDRRETRASRFQILRPVPSQYFSRSSRL
jgi:hypothetical protein